MLAVRADEYRTLAAAFPFAPLYAAEVQGGIRETYCLLVRSDSGFERVEDLRGHRIIVHRNPRASLSSFWLDDLLLEKGLGTAAEFMRVSDNTKLSAVILPVFFRQSDACLVTRNGFDTMSELNPQIGKGLRALATSPEVIPALLCFRGDYEPPFKAKILNALDELHQSPAGKQVLTIFRSERLRPIQPSDLQGAMDILDGHTRLLAAPRAGQASAGVEP